MRKNNKQNPHDQLNSLEKRAAFSLSGIYSLRMLGLFMIFPVFSLYAQELEGNTELLTGIAIGIYGLTQAIFQIPYGLLSDRLGRKPLMILGMLIFAIGSLIAGMADNIYTVIIGRAIQGSGAIAAVVMALAADLTREQHRLKIMAFIGMSIGMSFAVAMVAGSLLNELIGVDGIFYLIAFLALLGIPIIIYLVPKVEKQKRHRDAETVPSQITAMLADQQLVRLDIGIYILHMVLTANFIVLPMVLVNEQWANLPSGDHWMIYLPVFVLSIGLMVPFIIQAESKRRMKPVFIGAILVLALSELGFWNFYESIYGVSLFLLIFFTAFNLLEASLPSLVAKIAPAENKGTAMGVYSTSQFLGAFSGGIVGGQLLGVYGVEGVFLFSSFALLVWFMVAFSMKNPRYLSNYVVSVENANEQNKIQITKQLTEVSGVAEAIVMVEEGEAFLKVELHALEYDKLHTISEQYSN